MNRRKLVGGALCLGILAGLAALALPLHAASNVVLPDAQVDDALAREGSQRTIVLAGGCFWGVEAVFQHVRGVSDAVSGYAGGSSWNAKYALVTTGTTGHAESVKVTYDPAKISLGQLLKVFFSVAHDPTQRGGQGPDIGPQYRSAIFFESERQQQIAKAYVEQLTAARVFAKNITTQIVPLAGFYDAEAHHQDYAVKNPRQPYIVMHDRPKVEALRSQFPQWYLN